MAKDYATVDAGRKASSVPHQANVHFTINVSPLLCSPQLHEHVVEHLLVCRRVHRQVTAHGGIKGREGQLGRFVERSCRTERAVQDGFAVAWEVARLPADNTAMTRWPGTSKSASFLTSATWSTPAFERESDASTRPAGSKIPRQ